MKLKLQSPCHTHVTFRFVIYFTKKTPICRNIEYLMKRKELHIAPGQHFAIFEHISSFHRKNVIEVSKSKRGRKKLNRT